MLRKFKTLMHDKHNLFAYYRLCSVSLSRLVLLVISLFSLIGSAPLAVQAEEDSHSILVLYDSLAIGTDKGNNIEALKRVLASFGAKVTVKPFSHYVNGELSNYKHVIGIRNRYDLSDQYETWDGDLQNYSGAYMHIGADAPEIVLRRLNLELEFRTNEVTSLAIGQLHESERSISALHLIVSYRGKEYGKLNVPDQGRSGSFPYAVSDGTTSYVSYYEQGNLSELAIAYTMKDWLGIQRAAQWYVLFDEVYPFSDLNALTRMSDSLYRAGIPFIVNVSPVFLNTDYPAMQRFLEALKFVQSRNGSIIISAPNVNVVISQDMNQLDQLMDQFIDDLVAYGIAPLGIGAEVHWTYDEHFSSKGMGSFQSNVLFKDKTIHAVKPTNVSTPFTSSLYSVNFTDVKEWQSETATAAEPLPMDTAFVFPFPRETKEIEGVVQLLKEEWILFGDYKQIEHVVQSERNKVWTRNGNVYVNGVAISLNPGEMEISSAYEYIVQEEKSFERLFTFQNKVLVGLSLFSLTIFGCFLLIGHRIYKKKYEKGSYL